MRSTHRIVPAVFRGFCVVVLLLAGLTALDKAQGQATPPPPPPAQDQTAPDAGGPGGDSGVIALPKKKEAPADTTPPAPAEPKVKNPEGLSNFSLHVDVSEVTVDVGVLLEKTHQFVPGLKPNNFKVYEDGVEQKVTGFKRTEAPITALMVCEFAGTMTYGGMALIQDMRNGAFSFAQQLRPQDYVALMTYDMRTEIRLDFTQDKRELVEAINSLRIGGFQETNVFDALYEGIDRLERIEGRKYLILIGSGRDSFSKLTLDKILKKVKESHDITIYTISTGGFMRAMTEGGMGERRQMQDITFLQADNEMRTFANLTGGASYFPRFQAEYGEDFAQINQNIRSKYELVYHPTNTKLDGTFRKLRVELVDDEGQPLHIQDEKHKPLKYDIIARDGYRARQQVE